MRNLLVPALLLLVPAPLKAEGWAPIPAEVWAIKEDPAKGVHDAVVLERRVRLTDARAEFLYRIRILSEAGRAGAQIDLPVEARDIDGRTSYPDGTFVAFNGRKDMSTRILTTRAGYEDKRSVLIPPGVNANCVIEIRWYSYGSARYSGFWLDFASPYRTLVSSIQVQANYRWAWRIFAPPELQPVGTLNGRDKVITFTNLDPVEEVPYALDSVEPFPRFSAYGQPRHFIAMADKPALEFWNEVARTIYKEAYSEGVHKGSAFKAFAADCIGALPKEQGPVLTAARLLVALQAAWMNTDRLTYEQQAQRSQKHGTREPGDIEKAAELHETNSAGMRFAFFHLLLAAGLKPHVGLVTDRTRHLFDINFRNIWQFSHRGELVGVEVPGQGIHWFDPSLNLANPGMLHPVAQGSSGLDVDPATWTVSELSLPVQHPSTNQSSFTYVIEPSEDLDRIRMTAIFTGYPEFSLREDYLALEPKERNRTLRERLEASLPGGTFGNSEVLNVTDPRLHLKWNVAGQMEPTGGRRRDIRLFPGMPEPVLAPSALAAGRKRPIFMPHLWIQTATCKILVPKGFHCMNLEPAKKSNSFGKVSWTPEANLNGDTREITVTLRMELSRFSSPPSGWEELKEFLGWVQEYSRSSLLLEKD